MVHNDIDLRFETGSDQSIEPFGIQVGFASILKADNLRSVELDLQTVRFHRLHAEVFPHDTVAEFEYRLPQASLITRAGLNHVGIDAAHRVVVGLASVHPVGGVTDFHHHGVVGGQLLVEVRQHEVELQFIAGTPDSSVGVGECGHALFDGLAADVELAIGEGVAVVGFYQRLSAFTVFGDDEGGTVRAFQGDVAIAVGAARLDRLALIVISGHFRSRCWFGIGDLEDIHIDLFLVTHLGSHSEVGDEDVLLRFHPVIII